MFNILENYDFPASVSCALGRISVARICRSTDVH